MANTIIPAPWEEEKNDMGIVPAPWEDASYSSVIHEGSRNTKVFTGEEYPKPGGLGVPENRALYEQTGEAFGPALFDWRTQKTVGPNGDERTMFVPKAEELESTEQMNRMFLGGGLEAIKGTVEFSTWLLENMAGGDPDVKGDENEITGPIAKFREDFAKNFPTMPAANEAEKLVQEITSVVLGYSGGRKLTEGAIKKLELAPQQLDFLVKIFDKASRADKTGARAKAILDATIRGMILETGGNVGATAATPEGSDSFLQEWGMMEKGTDGDRYSALMAENTLFSAGIAALGKMYGATARGIEKRFKTRDTQANAAKQLLRTIDEGVSEGLPNEEIARRIEIYLDVVSKNENFSFEVLGDSRMVPLDATSATLRGAREYVERVYGPALAGQPPEVIETIMDARASAMADTMIAVKQGLNATAPVQASDASILQQTHNMLMRSGDRLATREQSGHIANKLTEPVVKALETPKPDLAAIKAQGDLAAGQNDDQLLQLVDEARRTGAFGKDAMDAMPNMLFENLKKDRARVDEMFANVPSVQLDPRELAETIKAAGDAEGLMQILGVTPKEANLVNAVGDPMPVKGGGMTDPVGDLAANIEAAGLNDVNVLVNKIRPLIAKSKSNLWDSGRVNKDTTQWDMLTDFIEQVARDAGPEFGMAMDEYKKYADKWLNTKPLAEFEAAAQSVRDVALENSDQAITPKGAPDMREQAWSTLKASQNATGPEYLQKFNEALKQSPNDNTLSYLLLSDVVNKLANLDPSKGITSADLVAAAQGPLKNLERIGDTETAAIINEAIETQRLIESGVGRGTADAEKAKAAYDTIIQKAQESAAYDLLAKTNAGVQAPDPKAAHEQWNNFFVKENLPARIEQLLKEADALGPETAKLARRGIKGEYVRYLTNKVTTSRSVGTSYAQGNVEFARDVSAAQLRRILDQSQGDTTLVTIDKLFADAPDDGASLKNLLSMLDVFVNGRSSKANPFGSDTAQKLNMNKFLHLAITMGIGILNPVATRLHRATDIFAPENKGAAMEAFKYIMGKTVTDVSFLNESMKAYQKSTSPEDFWNSFYSAGGLAARGYLGGARPNVDEQTQEAIPTQ